MAIQLTVNYTGTPSEGDIRGAHQKLDEEDARRAAQDPPLGPLPRGTGAELKASYLTMLAGVISRYHDIGVLKADQEELDDVKALIANATDAQRAAAKAAYTA